jgi:glycosyltransferase involved in cell wall biosynthesis
MSRQRTSAERRSPENPAQGTAPRWLESVPKTPAPENSESPPAPESESVHPIVRKPKSPSVVARPQRTLYGLICREDPAGSIAARTARVAEALAARGREVHVFCRLPIAVADTRVAVHAVGAQDNGDLIEQAMDFGRRVGEAIRQQRNGSRAQLVLIGQEWGSLPALLHMGEEPGVETMLALQSLERQRSDLGSALSQRIHELEMHGLRSVRAVLAQDEAVSAEIGKLVPECAPRVVQARNAFPVDEYALDVDPGAIKARYDVGPVDPTILFIGDLDERHGPDLLMRAMPAILKNHAQARLVVVGDGTLLWPLKVMSRYMLLDPVVRLVGHVGGRQVRELIAASDVVVVPSRVRTEDWQILSGWSAKRPVVATYQVAEGICRHEEDSVLIYGNPASVVWGIERVLFDRELGQRIAHKGHAEVVQRFGWDPVATQIESLVEPV